MRAQAVAGLEEAVDAAVLPALDPQHWPLIGDDPHRPARAIRGRALAPGQQLGSGLGFPALAERTRHRMLDGAFACAGDADGLAKEIVRMYLRREINQDRTAGDWVAPELARYHPGLNASL